MEEMDFKWVLSGNDILLLLMELLGACSTRGFQNLFIDQSQKLQLQTSCYGTLTTIEAKLSEFGFKCFYHSVFPLVHKFFKLKKN